MPPVVFATPGWELERRTGKTSGKVFLGCSAHSCHFTRPAKEMLPLKAEQLARPGEPDGTATCAAGLEMLCEGTSRARLPYLAARTHNRAAVCLREAHIAALREFWTDWLAIRGDAVLPTKPRA